MKDWNSSLPTLDNISVSWLHLWDLSLSNKYSAHRSQQMFTVGVELTVGYSQDKMEQTVLHDISSYSEIGMLIFVSILFMPCNLKSKQIMNQNLKKINKSNRSIKKKLVWLSDLWTHYSLMKLSFMMLESTSSNRFLFLSFFCEMIISSP